MQKQLKISGHISAIQIRYRGAKGVLLTNDNLVNGQIKMRKSMIKYETFKDTDIDILDYSKYRFGTLNRQIIILLLSLGVDPEGIEELQTHNLK